MYVHTTASSPQILGGFSGVIGGLLPRSRPQPRIQVDADAAAQASSAPASSSGGRKAVMDILSGTESPQAKRRMEGILADMPDSVLRNLHKHGLRIEITQGQAPMPGAGGAVAVGAYNLITRKISMDESVLFSDFGRHVVLHEVTHAVDHMRGQRTSLVGDIPVLKHAPVFLRRSGDSSKNDELKGLYADYQARSAVEDACTFRMQAQMQLGSQMPEHLKVKMDDGWGIRGVEYQAKGSKDVITFDNDPGWVARKVTGAVLGGIAAATGAYFGMPIVMNAGLGFIGLQGAFLAKDLATRKFGKEHVSQIDMLGGEKATVVQKGPLVKVEMPEMSHPQMAVWSPYAHRANMVEEYLAEGVSNYMEGGHERQLVEQQDPKLHAFVEGFIKDEYAKAG